MSAALSSPWSLILWQGLAIERAVSKFLSMFARGLKNKTSPLRPRPQIRVGKRLRMSMTEAARGGYFSLNTFVVLDLIFKGLDHTQTVSDII